MPPDQCKVSPLTDEEIEEIIAPAKGLRLTWVMPMDVMVARFVATIDALRTQVLKLEADKNPSARASVEDNCVARLRVHRDELVKASEDYDALVNAVRVLVCVIDTEWERSISFRRINVRDAIKALEELLPKDME